MDGISTIEYVMKVGSIINQTGQQHLQITKATVVTLRYEVVYRTADISLFDMTTSKAWNLPNFFNDTYKM